MLFMKDFCLLLLGLAAYVLCFYLYSYAMDYRWMK